MKVPLIAYHSGRILVIAGKEKHTLLQPFPPYYITSDTGRKGKKGKLMDLGKKKLVSVRKVEFGSSGEAAERATNLRNNGKGVQYLSYLETLFVDRPDFFREYPNGEPDIMSLDIEVYTDGSGIFPRAETSPIISIGVMYAKWVDGELQEEEPIDFQATKEDIESDAPDRRILLQFLQYLKDKNPDIILTYNGLRFDLPYIISRCGILGINPDEFSRLRAPWETRYQPRIPGHVHYDLYSTDVDRDQSILGIKNKKLKTVARWFNIPVIQLDGEELSNMSKLVETERLREYQHSDVKVLIELYKIYSPTHTALAEMLGIPLDSIINDYPSFVPKIISARKLRRAGYVALDTNRMRYRGMDAKYQAAYVDILKHGYIPKVWKMDFSGFYPSTMVNFNISPETTSIVRMDKFTNEDDFKFVLKGDALLCQIPDKNLKCNIIIRIDQSEPGLISEELRKLMEMRFKLKKEMKGKSLDEVARIMALTDAQKIIINSAYGIQGLSSTEFGDMSAAISIVGICRWIMKQVVEKYRDSVIEVDTDGIYIDSDIDVSEAEKYVTSLVRPITKIEDLIISLDKDTYGSGFFHLSKNYLLRELKEGKIIFHGVALKSSSHCLIYDKILNTVAELVLEETSKEDIWEEVSKFMDLSQYEMKDFIITMRLNKPMEEYVNENCLQRRLGKQVKAILDVDPYPGIQIEYLVTRGKVYKISADVEKVTEIDNKYYTGEIYKVLKIFGLDKIHQGDLFE